MTEAPRHHSENCDDRIRESELIALAASANFSLPDHVLIAPGDDMALVRIPGDRVLLAVDQVLAGRHFTPNTSLDLIARKAVARNVSDVAAMAGRPIATLACVTLPRAMSASSASELLASVRKYASAFGCPLIGGDTSVHLDLAGPLTLSITILAVPHSTGVAITRGGARTSDLLIVSGNFGGSLQGDGLGRHLTFAPRIAEADDLAIRLGPDLHAMIDISDGLGVDAARVIVESSKRCGRLLQARLDGAKIPCHEGVLILDALRDGEDYELFAAISPNAVVPLGWTVIGEVIDCPQGDQRAVVVICDDCEIDVTAFGWTHLGDGNTQGKNGGSQ